MSEAKHPGGRPTKYEERFCEELLETMRAGFSLTAFAGKIGVSRATINNWMDAHPEFMEAVSCAKAGRLYKWEEMGIKAASQGSSGPGASTMIVFGLKNMGGDEWSDTSKHEVTGKDGAPLPAPSPVTIFALPDNSRG